MGQVREVAVLCVLLRAKNGVHVRQICCIFLLILHCSRLGPVDIVAKEKTARKKRVRAEEPKKLVKPGEVDQDQVYFFE